MSDRNPELIAELVRPRRLAYADPPYPGQARSRYNGTEVDHAELIARLDSEFDGWALSTSASALLDVWKLAPHARCAAWVKTNARNGWSRVRWSWEPVLFVTDRRGVKPGERSEVWDSLVSPPDCNIQHGWKEVPGKGGGAKPYSFVRWLLGLLDFQDGDELVDLYPGSGAVTRYAAVEHLELFDVAGKRTHAGHHETCWFPHAECTCDLPDHSDGDEGG